MFFKLSLAEWSLNRSIKSGVINHLDFTTKRAFTTHKAKGDFTFIIEKENSAALIFVPKNAKIEVKEGKLYPDDVIIDYRYSKK